MPTGADAMPNPLPDPSGEPRLPDPPAPPIRLDMRAFLERQKGERYRAFLLHGPPGSGKTRFARGLAQTPGVAYIDVLATVAGDTRLSAQADVLDAAFLKTLALDAANAGANIVLVDEFDFLLPVWQGNIAPLVELVRKLGQPETAAIVGFVMQTVPALQNLALLTPSRQNRILHLDDLLPI